MSGTKSIDGYESNSCGLPNPSHKRELNCYPPHGGGGTELLDHLNVMAGSETTPPQNPLPEPSLARALTIRIQNSPAASVRRD